MNIFEKLTFNEDRPSVLSIKNRKHQPIFGRIARKTSTNKTYYDSSCDFGNDERENRF